MSATGVSVITVVYNEEKRIQSYVENFKWSGDVVVIDKSSTDRTAEVARAAGARVFVVSYCDNIPPEMSAIAEQCLHDWLFMPTASDLIHPALVDRILAEINKPGFDYDIIEYPLINWVFGIEHKNSPWEVGYRNRLFRKSSASFRDSVHREVTFKSEKTLRLSAPREHGLQHLTHETLDVYFERHHRYAKLEVERFKTKKASVALLMCLALIGKAIARVAFSKRSFMMGRDGVALSIAYVMYFMFIFLYTWQYFYASGPETYSALRTDYGDLWRSRQAGAHDQQHS